MHRVRQRLRERGHLVGEIRVEPNGGRGRNGEPLGEASRHVAPHQPSGRAMVDRSLPAPAAGAAGHDRFEHHALAEPGRGNTHAHFGDRAHRLVTHDERRDPPRARLAEAMQVRPADRRGARLDHDLAGSRCRIRSVLELHPARAQVHERPHPHRPLVVQTKGRSRAGTRTGTSGNSRPTVSTSAPGNPRLRANRS